MITKKQYGIALVLIVGLIVGTGVMFLAKKGGRRVAVLVPAVHPSMDQIQDGFIVKLKEAMPEITIDSYNANGNKTLMKSQVEEIVHQNYEAIFTVGTNASQMVKHSLQKKGLATPLVFAAVANPEERGIIDRSKKECVTGVTDSYDFADQVNLLLVAKPETKKVLLVYDRASNPAFDVVVEQLEKEFKKRGVLLQKLEVNHSNELRQKVASFLDGIDVVMTLTDHTVCSGMDSLIKICSEHNVTLYTSELDSNDKGAALSYGVYESEYGKEGAKKVIAILKDHQEPSSVPVTALQNYYLKINTQIAATQNLTINFELYKQYESRIVLNKGK